jgi:hypothetical protein
VAADRASSRRTIAVGHARGRRRPWLIGMGVLLSSVGALAVVWMVGAAGERQEVLVVRQRVHYGQPLSSSDLGIARVSVDPGVGVVPAGQSTEVVGMTAVTELLPGSLLTSGALSAQAGPRAGRVLVPLALPADRMPASGLRAGDRLLAVGTGDSEPGSTLAVPAEVVRIGEMDVNGVTVVDVTAATADGPRLTAAASRGEVAIVVQPSVV